MRSSTLTLVTLLTGASALMIPSQYRRQLAPNSCCFSLIANGGTISSALLDEDTIGENQIDAPSYPQGSYCVSPSYPAGLVDAQNHTCLIEPGSGQFQCVESGVTSTTKFIIGSDNLLQHDGDSTWFACPATGEEDDVGSFNVFASAQNGTAGCQTISLFAGGFSCSAMGRSTTATGPSSTATDVATQTSNAVSVSPFLTSTSVTTPTSISTSIPASFQTSAVSSPLPPTSAISAASTCPTNLGGGAYIKPNLLIPVSSLEPTTQYGTVFEPIIATTPENSTLFAFDIPSVAPYTGTCALTFLFPYASDAVFTYVFTGIEEEEGEMGGLDFSKLNGEINTGTTYATKPAVAADYGTTEIIPGNNYTIATFPCGGPVQLVIEASSVNGVGLKYFQDDLESAIGLYVVPCA